MFHPVRVLARFTVYFPKRSAAAIQINPSEEIVINRIGGGGNLRGERRGKEKKERKEGKGKRRKEKEKEKE